MSPPTSPTIGHDHRGPGRLTVGLMIAGVLILLGCGIIAWLSPQLQYETAVEQRPTGVFVAVYAGMGAVWLGALALLMRAPTTRAMLLGIILIGLLMRLVMLGTSPILEDDYHRYLWDGAVSAELRSPYAAAPAEVTGGDGAAAETLERINHPQYTTIYPPVAQGAFALAHVIEPLSVEAWRGVLLGCEVATLIVLLVLLRALRVGLGAVAVYWWCPVVVIELVQRLHMDALLGPLLLMAVLATVWQRGKLAAVMLGVAAGVKVWPVVLTPVLLRQRGVSGAAMVGGCAVAGGLAAVMIAPLLLAASSADSAGLVAYASHWHNNSALYVLLGTLMQPVAWITPIEAEHAHYLARPLLGVAFLLALGFIVRKPAAGREQVVLRVFAVIAMLFLLSPAQFPWYLTWLIWPAAMAMPLAFGSQRLLILAVLSYVVTMPLYYLTYDNPAMVWAVHLPPWIAIMAALRWKRSPTIPTASPVSASSSPR